MTKFQKIKKFVIEYQNEIFLTTTAVVIGALFVKAIKDANAEAEATNTWIREQHLLGNVVHQLIDGSYIAVKYTQQ